MVVWWHARKNDPNSLSDGIQRSFVVFVFLAADWHLAIFGQRLAHPPLGARASVERRVEVVVIINDGQQGGS